MNYTLKKKQLWFSKLLFFNYNLSLFYNQIWSNRKHDSSLPGRFHIIRSHCKQSRVYYRSRNTWRNRLPKRTSCKSHLITSAVSNFISSLGFSKSFVILFSLILIRKIISIKYKIFNRINVIYFPKFGHLLIIRSNSIFQRISKFSNMSCLPQDN